MGLLDDLKKQADRVKSQQLDRETLHAGGLKTVEEKMQQAFGYLSDLLKQLAIIQPPSPFIYALPSVGDVALTYADSFIDYRKKRIEDRDVFDSIRFYVRWQGPQPFAIEHDMPGTVQRIREALLRYHLKFEETALRNQRGAVEGTRFDVEIVTVSDVRIQADHQLARLNMVVSNLLRLGRDELAVPAADVSEAFLDDLGRCLLGQPSRLREYRVTPPSR